jgi:MGT family glycosyltransferase
MARFLIGTIPAIGHVNPAVPISRKLVERGHEVWWYTGVNFQSKVEATGARHIRIKTGGDFSDLTTLPESWLEQFNNLQGLAKFKFALKHAFIDSALAQFQDFNDILQEFPADVLVCDSMFLGGSWVSEKRGLPYAALNTSVLPLSSIDTAPVGFGIQPDSSTKGRLRNSLLNWVCQRIIFNDIAVYLDKIRGSIGLSRNYQGFFDATLSPFLFLQGTVPSFEYYRTQLPASLHFTSPFLPEPLTDFTPPIWWEDLKNGKPVIHVTQGTVATGADDLIVPTIQGLANEDVLVVVTTGGEPIESLKLATIPKNVRVEMFIPHYHLLPHVDVMVTNGGYNGVQVALANGIPLVAGGKTEDKPEVCARIEWSGVGINLKTQTPTSTQIRDAVKEILASPQYRQKAKLMQAEIASYDAQSLAATLLEQLAETKQPVLREN